MPDFHFITADPSKGLLNVPNASSYKLSQWLGTEAPTEEDLLDNQNTSKWKGIAVQLPIQTFDIEGRILSNGKIAEDAEHFYNKEVNEVRPNMEETPNGKKAYFRIFGKMTVKLKYTEAKTNIPFSGKLYVRYPRTNYRITILDDYTNINVGDPNNNGYDSLYLTVKVQCKDALEQDVTFEEHVEIYRLPNGHEVDGASIADGDISIGCCDNGFFRTTYIPIDCLTNSDLLDGGCVGLFEYSDGEYTEETAKICCYDENLNFLGSVTGDELPHEEYLTIESIKQFINAIHSTTKYVIFCSNMSNNKDLEDKVSVGNICFQLFDIYDSQIDKTYSPIRFSVKAEGDGLFYTDSKYSNAVEYPRVFEE